MVTRDHDFLGFISGPTEHPGVAFFAASKSLREIIEGLILIYEVMTPHEMAGHIEYL